VRAKWHKPANADIRIGTMVLIKETNVPPLQWNMGRFTTLNPGQDGVTIDVEVNTRGS